ncbi:MULTISPECIES: hypothetical protein [unclassified Streptomyces]|uniref:hypothetical protein n=1 Tax=unclassified Streptomyces TaxID=2593676 RepID=UPI002E2BE25A|nr:hypothetical protein [Streptomyces sp. NBC_01439]
MSFLSRIGCIETEEQERTRLAQADEGSLNHYLSTLPVTIEEWPKDLLVELPRQQPRTHQAYRVVVVPIEFREEALPGGAEEEPLPRKRHSGAWTCAVVFSDDPDHPAGGFRIDVPTAEIVRGRKIDLATALAPLSRVSGETLHAPEPLCGSGEERGVITHFDRSTDGITGHSRCDNAPCVAGAETAVHVCADGTRFYRVPF